MKKNQILWFVSWGHDGRTTETKVFYKLKDARKFAENKSGYITRQTETEMSLYEYFGSFIPTATEETRITALNK